MLSFRYCAAIKAVSCHEVILFLVPGFFPGLPFANCVSLFDQGSDLSGSRQRLKDRIPRRKFGCLEQKPRAGAVCRLPVPASVAKKVIGDREGEGRDDEKKKSEHAFFHKGGWRDLRGGCH
jgi:hypothetical protein